MADGWRVRPRAHVPRDRERVLLAQRRLTAVADGANQVISRHERRHADHLAGLGRTVLAQQEYIPMKCPSTLHLAEIREADNNSVK